MYLTIEDLRPSELGVIMAYANLRTPTDVYLFARKTRFRTLANLRISYRVAKTALDKAKESS